MKRPPTIVDIARLAGVSKGAVSFALNGQPGVSKETRARILTIAEELGWRPSSAARALKGAPVGAVGLVLKRAQPTKGISQFHLDLISGIEAALADRSAALVLQLVDDNKSEIEVVRRWWGDARVDGVIVTDLGVDDVRLPVLEELRMPAVVVGSPPGAVTLPAVWSDDAGAMEEAVQYLAALGHRRIARVAGLMAFRHTEIRGEAFDRACTELGLEGVATLETNFTRTSGAAATRRLLSMPQRPTAIIYDNDVMAVEGVKVADEMGISVPDQLSIIGWDDSLLCQMARPAVTTMSRDIPAYGYRAAELLFASLDGEPTADLPAASTYQLTPRETTAVCRTG